MLLLDVKSSPLPALAGVFSAVVFVVLRWTVVRRRHVPVRPLA